MFGLFKKKILKTEEEKRAETSSSMASAEVVGADEGRGSRTAS